MPPLPMHALLVLKIVNYAGMCRSRASEAQRLFGLLAQEGDEVISVLGLLQAAEGHLCARNVLLWVL